MPRSFPTFMKTKAPAHTSPRPSRRFGYTPTENQNQFPKKKCSFRITFSLFSFTVKSLHLISSILLTYLPKTFPCSQLPWPATLGCPLALSRTQVPPLLNMSLSPDITEKHHSQVALPAFPPLHPASARRFSGPTVRTS